MIEALMKHYDGDIQELSVYPQEPMSKHTSFRIGGPADLLVCPKNENALCAVVRAAVKAGLPLTVLGNGSNVLVRDEGIRGVVLSTAELAELHADGCVLEAQSGVLLAVLSKAALQEGLTGLEFAGGIPGSLGGALFMNAGAYDGQMKDVVISSRYYDMETDTIGTLEGEAHELDYRSSVFKYHPNWIVLSARMELKPGDPEEIRAKMEDFAQRRRDKQPLNYPSAGSTFKRPTGYFAGKLIQDSGLKGFAVGGAQVSEKHAGFVINRGDATCADVLNLIEAVQKKVFEDSGVKLEPEVRVL